MAGEILAAQRTGNTLYAHILNASGQRWNGTTFEAYTAGNYGDYDIALTEQGSSGVYVADFPSAITTPGVYQIVTYQQAGASPVQGDVIVGTSDVTWSGSAASISASSATLLSLAQEAFAKAGNSNPSASLLDRAQTKWIEEIRSDLLLKCPKLNRLMTRSIKVLTKGLGWYSNPADLAAQLTLEYATGAHYGTAQAGSTSSVTLAASEDLTSALAVGKEIAITSGTGLGGISYITAYSASTKVATVSPSFATAPISGDGYCVLDSYSPIFHDPLFRHSGIADRTNKGTPSMFYPEGDATYGGYRLHPIPYRDDSQPMVAIQRYYADLTRASLSGTLMTTLYEKWRSLWIAGLKYKALEDADDDRALGAEKDYYNMVNLIAGSEGYGFQLSELQATVSG